MQERLNTVLLTALVGSFSCALGSKSCARLCGCLTNARTVSGEVLSNIALRYLQTPSPPKRSAATALRTVVPHRSDPKTAPTARTTHRVLPMTDLRVEATVQGTTVCVLRKDLEADDGVDPNFFEEDYTVAASTGMVMWEGSWAAVELLRDPQSWLTSALRGRRVVELGSGIGLLGLAAAAAGAHVLLTDVRTVVQDRLQPNLEANGGSAVPCDGGAWHGSRSVGTAGGSVAAQPLNWFHPVGEQSTPNDPSTAEVVLAAECVWLQELVEPFVSTVLTLLGGGRPGARPTCILAFRERAKEGSVTFASGASVIAVFKARGCDVRLVGSDYEAPESRGLPTSLYEITPA